MKTEDLKAQGLTDEQIKFVMSENGKAISAIQKELADAKAEADNWKAQANNAKEVMSKFDGVDVDQLKKDVEEFKKQAKDAEANFKAQIAERDFTDSLDAAIRDAKGLNVKAIKALLDIETLKSSKNQNDDIKSAIEGLKSAEDSKMLFTAAEPAKKVPQFTSGMAGKGEKPMTKAEIMSIKDRSERRAEIAKHMELFSNNE